MFSKLALFALASVASFVVAAPSGIEHSCNTGDIHCCESTQKTSDNPGAAKLATILGLGTGDDIGLGCLPIVGNAQCQQAPLCCSNNNFGGTIVFGCSPLNANV